MRESKGLCVRVQLCVLCQGKFHVHRHAPSLFIYPVGVVSYLPRLRLPARGAHRVLCACGRKHKALFVICNLHGMFVDEDATHVEELSLLVAVVPLRAARERQTIRLSELLHRSFPREPVLSKALHSPCN